MLTTILRDTHNLTTSELFDEYHHIMKVFRSAGEYSVTGGRAHSIPSHYMGGMHGTLFFYNKLTFLANRFNSVCTELNKRDKYPAFTDFYEWWIDYIPAEFWNDWEQRERIKVVR